MEKKDNSGLAIASLVLGIAGLVLTWIPCCNLATFIIFPLGIIFGILSLKSSKKSLAIWGIVLNSIGVVFDILLIFFFSAAMVLPFTV